MNGIGWTVGNSLSTVGVCLRCVIEVEGGGGRGEGTRPAMSRRSTISDIWNSSIRRWVSAFPWDCNSNLHISPRQIHLSPPSGGQYLYILQWFRIRGWRLGNQSMPFLRCCLRAELLPESCSGNSTLPRPRLFLFFCCLGSRLKGVDRVLFYRKQKNVGLRLGWLYLINFVSTLEAGKFMYLFFYSKNALARVVVCSASSTLPRPFLVMPASRTQWIVLGPRKSKPI